ncbi:MAG: hypothetical protein KGY38_07420, partial [Desulfobacterales bacterium]|nr:hypothetical protein [Desulfobacterales bacterium]
MTTYYSNEYTDVYQDVPNSLVKANKMHGRLRIAYAKWNTGSSVSYSTSDEIYLFKLPAGARILPGMGRLSVSGKLDSSGTLAFGYGSSSAALADGSDFSWSAAIDAAFPLRDKHTELSSDQT